MYDELFVKTALKRLHELEQAKEAAQIRLTTAQAEINEVNEAIDAYRLVVNRERKEAGIPPKPFEHSPVLESEFKRLGPTELVEYRANKHDGNVVVKDLTKAALAAGKFKKYRNAYSAITSVLKRKNYEHVGEGHYRKITNGKVDFLRMMGMSKPPTT